MNFILKFFNKRIKDLLKEIKKLKRRIISLNGTINAYNKISGEAINIGDTVYQNKVGTELKPLKVISYGTVNKPRTPGLICEYTNGSLIFLELHQIIKLEK